MEGDRQEYKKIRAFQELFSGRFDDAECAIIISLCDNDLRGAVDYVMTTSPTEIRRRVVNEQETWQTVERRIRRLKEDRTVMERAKSGRVNTAARMFSCCGCDSVWWRVTPGRKQVSKCNRCSQRYDCLPREKEWGLAEFTCPQCTRSFNGYCAMWQTSPCFECGLARVRPTRIIPPGGEERPRSRFTHRCNAPGCSGNRRAPPVASEEDACVHPSSRVQRGMPRVVKKSMMHDSTGSTVATFLPQHDMQCVEAEFFPMLASVRESEEN